MINFYANLTGLWKKIAAWLPLIAGAGSVLVGAGNILLQVSHSQDLSSMLAVVKGLGPSDPNVLLITGGLTALGIHTNHSNTLNVLADHQAQITNNTTNLNKQ